MCVRNVTESQYFSLCSARSQRGSNPGSFAHPAGLCRQHTAVFDSIAISILNFDFRAYYDDSFLSQEAYHCTIDKSITHSLSAPPPETFEYASIHTPIKTQRWPPRAHIGSLGRGRPTHRDTKPTRLSVKTALRKKMISHTPRVH